MGTDKKLEQLKSRLLVRIGDIEKDTIEMKAAVAAELKKVKGMKEPLENATNLVDSLQSEWKARDEKNEYYEDTFYLPSNSKQDSSTEDATKCRILHSDKGIVNNTEESMIEFKLSNARLSKDLEKLSEKNFKLKEKKMRLTEDYDNLERYVNKVEKKLETKEAQFAELYSEKERCLAQVESLKELNERESEETRVLKHESMLLKDSIAEKDSKLSRLELQLRLYKEENLSKEVASLKHILHTASMEIDT